MARRHGDYQGVRSEGGLLPPDILRRLIDPQRPLVGLEPQDYGLRKNERVTDAITQSWNRLQKHWREFQDARAALPDGEAGTGLTNDRWSLPLLRELGFGLLPTGAGPVINGRTYPIARFAGPTPIHLLGCGLSLDKRAAGQRGAAQHNPHGMVQEYLNRSDAHLWGIVSNGLKLRVLRDNQALSRLSYLEFDLETILDAEAFGDFVILWLVAHATRFHPNEEGKPESCWLERWSQEAEAQGTRALDTLRTGVAKALLTLGKGFTDHPKNVDLRERLRNGTLDERALHAQLLRVVYRLIFLFVAEDRHLDDRPILHPPVDTPAAHAARERYADHYGTARLRGLAGRIKGSRHHDLWRQHQVVVRALHGGSDTAAARELLALPALGSFLWDPETTRALNDAHLSNFDLLETLRELAFTRQGNALRPVDYRNLGSEELGSVYEGLLALTPQIGGDGHSFTFAELEGNERKTSGSYYTPTSLVNLLLDSALDPVVEDAVRGKTGADAEKAILDLKVCDPSVGSGHFLIGAAHRLARHLARARAVATGEGEASPPEYQRALRDVIGHCLYGVDLNPMAVELCKVALWLEALEPGKPLSFLDHRIKTGNSLIGIDSRRSVEEVAGAGIPDEAYVPVGRDQRRVARELRDRNRAERGGQGVLFIRSHEDTATSLAGELRSLQVADDSDLARVRAIERAYAKILAGERYIGAKQVADAWVGAFFWPKVPGHVSPLLTSDLVNLGEHKELSSIRQATLQALAAENRFFHWQIEFPDAFGDSRGGFDAIVGNPPWDVVESPLGETASDTFARLQNWFRSNEFSLLQGRRDLYKLFLIQAARLVRVGGRLGFLVPLGAFIEDDSTRLRQYLFDGGSVVKLFHFQNHGKRFFATPHASYRFCGIVFAPERDHHHRFSTVIRGPDEFVGAKHVEVKRTEFDRWLGDSRSASIFPTPEYAVLHRALISYLADLPQLTFQVVAEFHASTDRSLMSGEPGQAKWRVPKNRNIHLHDAEFAEYDTWVDEESVRERLARKGLPEELFANFPRLLFRDIARNDDERTLLACLAPPGFVSTYDTPMLVPVIDRNEYPMALAVYAGAAATFVVDFLIRPFVDKHIKGYTLSRVPWPDFRAFSSSVMPSRQVAARVLELVACQHPMDKFVSEFGWPGVRYRSDEERRWFIMRELDAAFFHQFLPIATDGGWDSEHDSAELRSVAATPRDAVALVMDTFPIVARKDEQAYGNYRTRQTILQVFDDMTRCRTEGRDYVSPLNPPPGPPLDEDGNPGPLEDLLTDPPPHIHLSDELLSKAQVLHLGDLVRVFPPTPFRLQMGTASGARRVQVTPTPTAELVNAATVAMACPELRVHGQPVAVAFGVLAIEQRTDANTGHPFVHVTIRSEDGTATARLATDEWRDMTTIGVIDTD